MEKIGERKISEIRERAELGTTVFALMLCVLTYVVMMYVLCILLTKIKRGVALIKNARHQLGEQKQITLVF